MLRLKLNHVSKRGHCSLFVVSVGLCVCFTFYRYLGEMYKMCVWLQSDKSCGVPNQLARYEVLFLMWFYTYLKSIFVFTRSWILCAKHITPFPIFVKWMKNKHGRNILLYKSCLYQFNNRFLIQNYKSNQCWLHLSWYQRKSVDNSFPIVSHICVSESGQHWFR